MDPYQPAFFSPIGFRVSPLFLSKGCYHHPKGTSIFFNGGVPTSRGKVSGWVETS